MSTSDGMDAAAGRTLSSQIMLAGVGLLVFAGAAVGIYASADTSDGESAERSYAAVALATTTTTSTTTTTTTTTVPPPTTTLAPGVDPPPSTDAPETTEPEGPLRDPADYPDERPEATDIVGGVLYDLLTAEGVPGNQANCAIQVAYETADGDALLAMGIAEGNPEALAIVNQGGLDCGISQETLDAAIIAGLG